ELRSRLWAADTFVDFDHGLNNAVARIREVLDDSSETPRYVETIPRRGYRFIAPLIEAKPKARMSAAQPSVLPVQRKFPQLVLLAVITTLVVLGVGIGFVFYRNSIKSTKYMVIQSLAVLPLENLSGDKSQEYFADGTTDALITDLAQIGTLRVISRTSVMRYKA